MSANRPLHQHALQLAAAALDFGLDEGEHEELEAHLATCLACRRGTHALRADALRLAPALPMLLPSRRVDEAVFAEIARRRRPFAGAPSFAGVPVLVAASLLLVALLGVVAAGAVLLGIWPPKADVPPTLPVVVVEPTPTAVPSHDASPLPTGKPLPPWKAVHGELPADSGRVQLAPGPYGGVYVLVNADDGAVLALLDGAGEPRSGWPTELPGWTCDAPATSAAWAPGVARDGSVRLVCYRWDAPDDPVFRAFAFDAEGRPMDGWPVALPPDSSFPPRVVGDALLVVAHERRDPEEQAESPIPGAYWLVQVAPDGTTRTGGRLEVEDIVGGLASIGPDGTGWLVDGGEIRAFDMDGPRAGWPVHVDGALSALGFGPDGTAFVATALADDAMRLFAFDRDGSERTSSRSLPISAIGAWTGAGPEGGPMAPLVAPDGTAFVIGRSGSNVVVYRIDASGAPVAGWPYRVAGEVPLQGACPPEALGCGAWRAMPAVDPNAILYLPLATAGDGKGGRIEAISTSGKLITGSRKKNGTNELWPVWLVKEGAEFWSIVAASGDRAYAVAVEPERGDTTSATIIEFAVDSIDRWKTTVVQPGG